MKVFIKLTLLTIVVIVACGLFFEYCVNRPMNVYLQYAITAVFIIGIVVYLVYLVKQLLIVLKS